MDEDDLRFFGLIIILFFMGIIIFVLINDDKDLECDKMLEEYALKNDVMIQKAHDAGFDIGVYKGCSKLQSKIKQNNTNVVTVDGKDISIFDICKDIMGD